MVAAGRAVANHSYSHPPFAALTGQERREGVERADRAIRAAAGAEPLPFFRFPYGDTTPAAGGSTWTSAARRNASRWLKRMV
ncbi:polysaccharide deacetylase family protein [Kitasatospora sp. NPDC127059]|uniref:polysaccharide deacetylase family protein n=1 Tax=unclassified Kitasatospora TaxID=2633591 RepID=UPI0036472720